MSRKWMLIIITSMLLSCWFTKAHADDDNILRDYDTSTSDYSDTGERPKRQVVTVVTETGLPEKSWVGAALLSLLIPGTGQWYNAIDLHDNGKQVVKGIVFFSAAVGLQVAANNKATDTLKSKSWDEGVNNFGDYLGLTVFMYVVHVVAAVEAGVTANRINQGKYILPQSPKVSLQISPNRLMLCYRMTF